MVDGQLKSQSEFSLGTLSAGHRIKDRVWFGLCRFLVTAHVIFVQAVPVPGDKISLPSYESTESCESLLQVEWQHDLSPQQTIFSLGYGMQVDIM